MPETLFLNEGKVPVALEYHESVSDQLGTTKMDTWSAVYDVTRRETFESLGDIWMQEVDMYSTVENAIKMVVANKVDKVKSTCLFDPASMQEYVQQYLGFAGFLLSDTHSKPVCGTCPIWYC